GFLFEKKLNQILRTLLDKLFLTLFRKYFRSRVHNQLQKNAHKFSEIVSGNKPNQLPQDVTEK
ncbi:hypothetical protein QN360_03935, partial [Glaciimonas sp. CA11.2]|uniref:hypothetical protein n=1 Tax=Glaciimonas sp. CA11.2 TaxID=3048601 RepID=UPI002B22F24A